MSKRQTKTTEQLKNELARYNRRLEQLKTRRERIAAKIKFYENNYKDLIEEGDAKITTQNKNRGFSAKKSIDDKLAEWKESVARLDFLILRNEGGTITQEMVDYNIPNLFQYKNEAENRDYVAGDVFVPKDNDRVNLIKNVTEKIDDRDFAFQISQADDTPDPNFPRVDVTNPNTGEVTSVDKADYYGGTMDPYTSDTDLKVNSLLEKLRIQETALERSEGKIDLTRQLQIEPRMVLPQNGK